MPSAFTITLFFIVLTTIIGAFIKGRSKDRCLLDFKNFPVTVEMKSGKAVWGNLIVEATGLELVYGVDYLDKKDGRIEKSYILYKNDFANIGIVVRYHDTLNEKQKLKREKVLRRYYHPRLIHPIGRKIRNFFYTVRDAAMDVITLLIGRIRTTTSAGTVLSGQDKYVSEIQKQIIPTAYSFEPLLEKYIGKKVILKLNRGDKFVEYLGMLKDYTPDFIEILDVEYKRQPQDQARKADIIVSRQSGIVRHLGK